MHVVFSLGVSAAAHFQISVDDFQGVEVSDSLQHLPHHVAGVPLGVIALIQDPVKHLPAGGAARMRNNRKNHDEDGDNAPFFFFFFGQVKWSGTF